ncbi:MAG: hypothetical protein HY289_00385 [Planctomycetes bacterium]|nr:hypothetical protein [Planctomycetota bacterium]
MDDLWPGLCAAAALIALLVLIIRYHVHAFIALFVVSLGLGLAAGLPPAKVVDAISKGIGDILRDVLLLLGLGAMLGRMLETSGAAELIARRILTAFGQKNTSFAIALAAYLVGLPILFNVGFLVLIPIIWRLQRETNKSLLFFLLPLSFSLGITHSLVPPHPGIVGAVTAIATPARVGRVMVETIIFGIALSFVLALLGWFGPGRFWAHRQFVPAPIMAEPAAQAREEPVAKSFALALTIILAPLVLSVLGFGATLLQDLHRLPAWMTVSVWHNHTALDWLQFLGKPTVALFVPTALAFWSYGLRRGWSHAKLAKLTSDALVDVGSMVFLFGAAGGFKEVIQATGVGDYIKDQAMLLPLSPVAIAFCVAGLMRIALGSATAAILTASALVAGIARTMPGLETLLVLSVACGVTVGTQPADSGFWMIKEYGNLSPPDVMLKFNACRFVMALAGLGILLIVEAFIRA